MRRQFAGPSSSNYKEKDHNTTKIIDPAVANTKITYIQRMDEYDNKNKK